MTGKTHLAAGICTGIALSAFALQPSAGAIYLPPSQPLWMLPAGITCAAVGSLFPDVDWQTSQIGRRVKPISKVINFLFGHRSLFHAPILYLIIYFLVSTLKPQWQWLSIFFVAGAASHLLLDMMNVKGIPLFYPWTKHFWLAKMKNDGKAERIIRYGLYGATAAATLLFLILLAGRLRFYM